MLLHLALQNGRCCPTLRSVQRNQNRRVVDPELLVLDELGLEIGRDATRQGLLFEVLNARYGQQRATILLGNLRLCELTHFLGERIVDRLCDGASPVVSFNWPSHRRLLAPIGDVPPAEAAADYYRQTESAAMAA